jgi:hypothetical protein
MDQMKLVELANKYIAEWDQRRQNHIRDSQYLEGAVAGVRQLVQEVLKDEGQGNSVPAEVSAVAADAAEQPAKQKRPRRSRAKDGQAT